MTAAPAGDEPVDGDHRPIAATVGGEPVHVDEVDAREADLRSSELAGSLPAMGTSEGRQLRRWLTQLLVSERVVAMEAAARGIDRQSASAIAPSEHELLPDPTARLEIGSIGSAILGGSVLARALFQHVTAHVDVTDGDVRDYHARNPYRFASSHPTGTGWDLPASDPPPLDQVRAAIAGDLRLAARRREFAAWLDARRAALVRLEPGYEHPGDPRQPDNTHKH